MNKPARYILFHSIVALLCLEPLTAQQLSRLSQYNFASAMYNPAATGSSTQLTLGGAFRGQWIGLEGAPNTQVLFVDQQKDRVGLGGYFRNDVAGSLSISDLYGTYSYQIPLSEQAHLRGGLSAGISNWRNDFTKLRLDDLDDPQFLTNINRWLPNFGAGVQWSHTYGQIGFGVPQLFEYNLNEDAASAVAARTFRHYYLQARGNIWLRQDHILLLPQAVLASSSLFNSWRKAPRNEVGAPNALDLGVNALIDGQFECGLQWRTVLETGQSSPHSIGLMAGWILPGGLSVMGTYEIPRNPVQRATDGSFELLVKLALKKAANKPTNKSSNIQFTPPIIKQESTPAPAPAPTPEAPEVAEKTVEGIVFDMREGLPTEGARVSVTVTDCSTPHPPAYITPADGRYRFSLSPNCCYTLTAQKDGLKTAVSEKICTNQLGEQQTIHVHLELLKQ